MAPKQYSSLPGQVAPGRHKPGAARAQQLRQRLLILEQSLTLGQVCVWYLVLY